MKKKNLLLGGLSAALAIIAGIFIVKKKKSAQEGKPSKRAPQVPISNPGDQSEFPTTASESELG